MPQLGEISKYQKEQEDKAKAYAQSIGAGHLVLKAAQDGSLDRIIGRLNGTELGKFWREITGSKDLVTEDLLRAEQTAKNLSTTIKFAGTTFTDRFISNLANLTGQANQNPKRFFDLVMRDFIPAAAEQWMKSKYGDTNFTPEQFARMQSSPHYMQELQRAIEYTKKRIENKKDIGAEEFSPYVLFPKSFQELSDDANVKWGLNIKKGVDMLANSQDPKEQRVGKLAQEYHKYLDAIDKKESWDAAQKNDDAEYEKIPFIDRQLRGVRADKNRQIWTNSLLEDAAKRKGRPLTKKEAEGLTNMFKTFQDGSMIEQNRKSINDLINSQPQE